MPRAGPRNVGRCITETRDTGLVRIHVRQTAGGSLRYGASVSVTPDSSSGLVANDTLSTFRVSRPFRLWVRSIGHRQADTVIAPRPGSGVAIDVQLPYLVVGGPPLCIER